MSFGEYAYELCHDHAERIERFPQHAQQPCGGMPVRMTIPDPYLRMAELVPLYGCAGEVMLAQNVVYANPGKLLTLALVTEIRDAEKSLQRCELAGDVMRDSVFIAPFIDMLRHSILSFGPGSPMSKYLLGGLPSSPIRPYSGHLDIEYLKYKR